MSLAAPRRMGLMAGLVIVIASRCHKRLRGTPDISSPSASTRGTMMSRANDSWTIVQLGFSPRAQPAALSLKSILSQVAESLTAAPTCSACGVNKAEAAWLVSPIGSVYGVCARCAGLRRLKPTTEITNSEYGNGRGPGI
jgi:hypothetical protein